MDNSSYFFVMKDNYAKFSVSLHEIEKCLLIAEKLGYVPRLPAGWTKSQKPANDTPQPDNPAVLVDEKGIWCQCEHCDGDYTFIFKDSAHEIHISLEMVLQCIKSAEMNNAIKKLGTKFWFPLCDRYPIQSWG